MINLCGKCGSLAMDLDKHLGFHQYMLPGPLNTFILKTKGSLSLGVVAGFNPLKDAKWIAPELYNIPGLQDELVQVTTIQNNEFKDGYCPLPDNIIQFKTIAFILRGFIRQNFPTHLQNYEEDEET